MIKEVLIKARIEVNKKFNINEISLCVTEWDLTKDTEITHLKTEDFSVIDYLSIKEVQK